MLYPELLIIRDKKLQLCDIVAKNELECCAYYMYLALVIPVCSYHDYDIPVLIRPFCQLCFRGLTMPRNVNALIRG